MADIQAGDEVTVRGVVTGDYERSLTVAIDGHIIAISAVAIATHTPKPREIKVGDSVVRQGRSSYSYTVKAVMGDRLLILRDDNEWGRVVPLSDVKLADGDD